MAGFSLLARWWSLHEDSPFWAFMTVLDGNFLLSFGILRITQAPHPRLGKNDDREPLQRALAITSFVTGDSSWSVPAAIFAFNVVLDVRSTRRSWRYLKALHANASVF